MEFFGSSLRRRLDRVTLFDKRIEIDHFDMCMKGFEDSLARDSHRKGSDCSVDRSFRHGGVRRSCLSRGLWWPIYLGLRLE